MSYAVELYFDELGESRVCDFWRELALTGVRFKEDAGVRPHVSLAVCDDVDVPLAGKLLERFAETRPPFSLTLASFGVSPAPDRIAFMAPKATAELRELQAQFIAEFSPLAEGVAVQFSPEHWVPYGTLSAGAHGEELVKAVKSCPASGLQLTCMVTEIRLVRAEPLKTLALAPFGRRATVDERGGRAVQEAVHVVPSDPGWVGLFEREKKHLRSCLPAELLGRIEHFGSTSVPGLAAKPVVDMLVEVTDLEATQARIVPLLEEQGYDYYWRPVAGDADDDRLCYAWFIKRSRQGERTHHIHMIEGNHPMWEQLRFRDILRGRPALAEAYARLKMSLAEAHRNDREAYTNAKGDFIASAMRFVEPFGG